MKVLFSSGIGFIWVTLGHLFMELILCFTVRVYVMSNRKKRHPSLHHHHQFLHSLPELWCISADPQSWHVSQSHNSISMTPPRPRPSRRTHSCVLRVFDVPHPSQGLYGDSFNPLVGVEKPAVNCLFGWKKCHRIGSLSGDKTGKQTETINVRQIMFCFFHLSSLFPPAAGAQELRERWVYSRHTSNWPSLSGHVYEVLFMFKTIYAQLFVCVCIARWNSWIIFKGPNNLALIACEPCIHFSHLKRAYFPLKSLLSIGLKGLSHFRFSALGLSAVNEML